jgi:CheY-like chemotaxis protein
MALRILIVEDTQTRQEALIRLCKDHAWVLVHTGRRAITLIRAYEFDLIFLDYDLAGLEKGDTVAEALAHSPNRETKVIVHAMNAIGAKKIQALLPRADLVPFSRMTKDNATFKRFRDQLAKGVKIDWQSIFQGEKLKVSHPG